MNYYNWKTKQESPALPTRLEGPIGTNTRPKPDDLIQRGWILDPITPFVCPEGRVIIPGTQIVQTDTEIDPCRAWYYCETRTVEEQQAIDAAAEAARQAAKPEALRTAENALITWIRANVPGASDITKMPDNAAQKLRNKIKAIADEAVAARVYVKLTGLIEDVTLAGGYLQDCAWHE